MPQRMARRLLRPVLPVALPHFRVLLGAVALVLASVAAPGCATAGQQEEDVAAGDGAQSATLPDAIATIEADPTGGDRLARIGPSRYALKGDRVGELAIGRRYKVSLASTREPRRGDFEVRLLLDLRPVIKLIGTLSDDVQDPAVMHFRSLHDKSYALYGDTVGGYKDIRGGLPDHDYAKTLFAVNAVHDLGGSVDGGRWEWLEYTPMARYKCAQSDSAGTHLDLVDVKPDDSLLDGFITTPLGGREVRYGAHAVCTRDGGGYACALDSVGNPWGTARFLPASGGRFDLTVERADAAHTKIAFGCDTVAAASLTAQSED